MTEPERARAGRPARGRPRRHHAARAEGRAVHVLGLPQRRLPPRLGHAHRPRVRATPRSPAWCAMPGSTARSARARAPPTTLPWSWTWTSPPHDAVRPGHHRGPARRLARGRPFISFLQLPEWGGVKSGWRPESVGWFESSRLVGAGLVLYRPVPRLPRRSLAYLPEGPDIDWLRQSQPHLSLTDWLNPLLEHCRHAGAFQVKMGPPVALRRWEAETDQGRARRPGRAPRADRRGARRLALRTRGRHASSGSGRPAGSQEPAQGAGFGDVQPRYVFQVPLSGRTLDDVFAGFNQLWRRNIRKAEKAGVVVSQGGRADLAAFHRGLRRDGRARPLHAPRRRRTSSACGTASTRAQERLRLYCAHHDGHLAAATLMVVVGRHAWYSYGASTTADRDVRPSNALQWRMISDAHALGCDTYDLRGIADTLDPAEPPVRPGAVQGGHRRLRAGVRRRVGPRAATLVGQGFSGVPGTARIGAARTWHSR